MYNETQIWAFNMLAQVEKRLVKERDGHLYHSRTEYLLPCKNCGFSRWIRRDSIKRKCFTGLCQHCIGSHLALIYSREATATWKGGKYKDKDGYICISVPKGDFFFPMTSRSGYIKEHRLVMAQYLNRCLLPWEVVHHKNGIKDDNRLENLELLPSMKQHLPDLALKARLHKALDVIKARDETIKELQKEISLLRRTIKKET